VTRHRRLLPLLVSGLSLVLFANLSTKAQQSTKDEPAAKDRQIAEIQKQMEELTKKLEALKKEPPKEPEKPPGLIPDGWLKELSWREIGPAAMGGRIVAISVYAADPCTYWVATASGGLLKTENNGITFTHQFDKEAVVSIGDVCVAPSDKNIIWVGTGESNPRNSVSYGDGIYKSTDGGKSWKNMGLKKSFQIGRVLVHPKDPNIVYVGALGRLYGPSEERGLFKTTDGGNTWDKILYIDDKSGVIDMEMNPNDPETLLVAMYERQRDAFDVNEPAKRWGPGSGLHKTTDGGKTWKKLTNGLPTSLLGRMGIDYYRKDPNTIFLILECEKIGMGPVQPYFGVTGQTVDEKATIDEVTANGPAQKAGLKTKDIINKFDDTDVKSYDQLTELIRSKKVGDKIKLKVTRESQPVEIELTIGTRPAPSTEAAQAVFNVDPSKPFGSQLNGQRQNVTDKDQPEGWQYGGIYKSTDGGESWTRINSLNPRPMYFSQVRVDPSDDKYLYVLGISFYRSKDGGKSFTADGGRGVHADGHALWIDPKDGRHQILGCDGGFYVTYDRQDNWDHLNHLSIGQFYHVAIDTRRDYKVYGGLQDNGSWGGPSRTRNNTGPINEDWLSVGQGDGFSCRVDPNDPDQIYWTSQNGNLGRRNLRTGEVGFIRPAGARGQTSPYRFNWSTPFILSHHNSRIYYSAGNFLFRSLDRGNDLRVISPELSKTNHGSATCISESPRNPNILYVGTDDGALWVMKDGGKEWSEISKNVGLPGLRHVASVEASRFEEGRAYVCFDGHRSDDDKPYIFVTEDYGLSWKPITSNLPEFGSTRVLREDTVNPNLLFLGTEFGAWCSIDRGKTWNRLNTNLPTVAVHEFAIHPTAGEIVAATHGRSLWILDVSALRQLTPETLKAVAFLYQPNSAVRWKNEPNRGRTNRRFAGDNPQRGAMIYYTLANKAEKASLKVLDVDGKTVLRELSVSTQPGLHASNWALNRAATNAGGGGGRGGRGGQGQVRSAAPARQQSDATTTAVVRAVEAESAVEPNQTQPQPQRRGGGVFGALGGPPVLPGAYRVVLTVDGKEYAETIRVEPDPSTPASEIMASEGYLTDEEIFGKEDEEEEEEATQRDRAQDTGRRIDD
jgi:photosystem II stability/assembly factor-like uncharacterized protein